MATHHYHFDHEITSEVPSRFAELVSAQPPGALVLLSGGHTIVELTGALHRAVADRHLLFGQVDERVVDPSSPDANRTSLVRGLGALDALYILDLLRPDERRTLSSTSEDELLPLATELAHRYDQRLHAHAPIALVHLGLGVDGHTASLFPGSAGLEVHDAWVCANTDPSGHNAHPRVTVTFSAIAASARRIVVATGAAKADVVYRALTGEGLPIHRLPREGTLFLLDQEAAARLS